MFSGGGSNTRGIVNGGGALIHQHIVNCYIFDLGYGVSGMANVSIYNTTIKNCDVGANIAMATGTIKNSILQNNNTNLSGTTWNEDNNINSGAIFQADGYHLSASDMVAQDQVIR